MVWFPGQELSSVRIRPTTPAFCTSVSSAYDTVLDTKLYSRSKSISELEHIKESPNPGFENDLK